METQLTQEESQDLKEIINKYFDIAPFQITRPDFDHPIVHVNTIQDIRNIELENQDFFTGTRLIFYFISQFNGNYNIFSEYINSFKEELEFIDSTIQLIQNK